MTYDCVCCLRRDADGCRCVFGTCRRCLYCLTHCTCPERHARACDPDPALDAEGGPFHPPGHADSRTANGP